jgi:ATP-dependent RNA helicase RhlE
MSFEAFNLAPPLLDNITHLGYARATPIQAAAIPVVMEGRDVVGLAQTGTGKTAAFVLPILQRLLHGPHRARALIIGPTRELAEQTHKAIQALGRHTGLHSATIYGGVGMRPQIDALRRGAEIVVACPGRLLDHIGQRTIDLSHVEVLVLDEADQMFDMGFLPDIRLILKHLPAKRQTLLFSATMPDAIRTLAREILRQPADIRVSNAAPVETVSHAIFPVSQHLKGSLLAALLRQTGEGPVLVFTRTRHKAKRLGDQLAREGFTATSIQGNLSQRQRQTAMDGFRSGRFRILVATDIAARGIDVSGISHVINFDMPDTTDTYIHRIGRTGRAAKTGDAFTLVTREDAELVRQIERVLKAKLERRYVEGFDYDAAAPAGSSGQDHDRRRHPQHQRHPHHDRGPRHEQHRKAHSGGHRPSQSSGHAAASGPSAPATHAPQAHASSGPRHGHRKGSGGQQQARTGGGGAKPKAFWQRFSRRRSD